jgi:LmbE family N-acetylglucosaminyl deacetylase
MPNALRLLILGAHPDDPDFHAGGLAAIYRSLGHTVKMISLTNGDAGHQQMEPAALAIRRRAEAAAAGRVIGAEYLTWDHHDGTLQPTLELRFQVIREIRTFQPDLLLTHRTNDYHPDHRAVGNVVRDASFMVTVPRIVPDVPILRRDPVVAYMPDRFTKPYPLAGDVVVDTTEHVDTVVDMLCCHESQVYEWLPYNRGVLDQVPPDPNQRPDWVKTWYLERLRPFAESYRQELVKTYGPQRGSQIEFAEVFEISEYASPLDAAARRRLFPFLPDPSP